MSLGTEFRVGRQWEARIARAQQVEEQQTSAKGVLNFYTMVLEFQRDLARSSTARLKPELPLREQVDLSLATAKLPALFDLAAQYAPDLLAARASALRGADDRRRHELMRSALSRPTCLEDPLEDFFARSCLQPLAENLQFQMPMDRNYNQSVCPACAGHPQASVLRPEGEGARRWLLCSFCLREWLFRRVVCPWCGEQDKEKLPYYSAEAVAHVRIEACDVCKKYLKAVDLSRNGHALPVVDEVATAVLDVWASEHGYRKIVPNLMGF
jgi:FdhE protein